MNRPRRKAEEFRAAFEELCDPAALARDQLAALQLILDKEELDEVLSWHFVRPHSSSYFHSAFYWITDAIPF